MDAEYKPRAMSDMIEWKSHVLVTVHGTSSTIYLSSILSIRSKYEETHVNCTSCPQFSQITKEEFLWIALLLWVLFTFVYEGSRNFYTWRGQKSRPILLFRLSLFSCIWQQNTKYLIVWIIIWTKLYFTWRCTIMTIIMYEYDNNKKIIIILLSFRSPLTFHEPYSIMDWCS